MERQEGIRDVQGEQNAEQIITLLEEIKQNEENKYESNKKLLETLGLDIEYFDEGISKQLAELAQFHLNLGCNNDPLTSLTLHGVESKAESLANDRRKNKLNVEIKKISKVTNETKRLTKRLQSEYEMLQEDSKLLNVDAFEQTVLLEKIKRYNAVVKKLKDEQSHLSEHSIEKYEQDIENLRRLQRKQVELNGKLEKCMGASADLDTLTQQIDEVEAQYKQLQLKFSALF